MFSRLPIFFCLLLSLALGPVRVSVGCETPQAPKVCQGCCDVGGPCCVVQGKSKTEDSPASVLPESFDGKQLVSPVLFFICALPEIAERQPVVTQPAACVPERARIDVTGIRLI